MKNNFKKIIIGLLMLSSFTGCSDLFFNSSLFNSSNLSSKISDIINNSTSHNYSDNDDGTFDEIESEYPIESNEVSKDVWENALAISNLNNLTIELNINAEIRNNPNLPSYIKTGAIQKVYYKIANSKAEIHAEQSSVMNVDKEVLKETMNLNDEDAEIVIEQLAGQSNGTLEKEGDIYKIVITGYDSKEFLEKDTEETSYYYGFRENFNRYYKSKQLIGFEERALGNINIFLFADFFLEAEYDQTKKAYSLDASKIEGDMQKLGFEGNVYYYFTGTKLARIIFDGIAEQTQVKYVFNFTKYDSTSVVLPSNNELQPCDHITNTSNNYNEKYHYVNCTTCSHVLEYEEHEFGTYGCKHCFYIPTEKEEFVIEGLDNEIKSSRVYNSLNGELYEIDFIYRGSGSASWHSIYDEETDREGTEIRIGGAKQYIKALWKNEQISNQCLVKRTITYYFFDVETNEEVLEPIVVETKRISHELGESNTIQDGCKRTITNKCVNCDYETSYNYYFHNYNEPIYGEKSDKCIVISSTSCKDCSHVEYRASTDHDITFIILDKDNSLGAISCPDCGLSETGSYRYNFYGSEKHNIEFRTTRGNYISFEENHHFEDGYCACGKEEPKDEIIDK